MKNNRSKNKQNLITALTVFFILLLLSITIIVFVADVRKANDRALPVSCVDDRSSSTVLTSGVYTSADTDTTYSILPFPWFGAATTPSWKYNTVTEGSTTTLTFTNVGSMQAVTYLAPFLIQKNSTSFSFNLQFGNYGGGAGGLYTMGSSTYLTFFDSAPPSSFSDLHWLYETSTSDYFLSMRYYPIACCVYGLANPQQSVGFPAMFGVYYVEMLDTDFDPSQIRDFAFITDFRSNTPTFNNGWIIPTVSSCSPIAVEIFDVNGKFITIYTYYPTSSLPALKTRLSSNLYTDLRFVADQTNYDQGYKEGYTIGYSKGDIDGYNRGNNQGYTNGYKIGYDNGNSAGFSAGVASANDYSFLGLIGSVIDAPIQAFMGLLSFDVLGVNLSTFVLTLFTFCIILKIVSYVL